MSSDALKTQGITIGIGDGASPETFTTIKEVSSFQGPGGAASVIDVTDLSSTAKEKRMGIPDEGQLSFNINYIPTDVQHTLLRTKRAAGDLVNFKMTFTDASPASTWEFSAYVTGFTLSGGVDAKLEAAVTLEISGAITES